MTSTPSLSALATALAALLPISAPSLVTLASLVTESISFAITSFAPLTAPIVLLLAFFASDILPDSSFNLFLVILSPSPIFLKCSPTLLLLSPDLTTVSPKESPIALPKMPKIS
ncbi:hypothetical protein A7978_05685 (plasmid) [Borrelia turicatae]|uniref:Uncharacterized protein n=1 Tax=Borrelia turicatae TaxID=142 RepID=A0A172XCZ9_BORTU|nr:hypothetical protein A7978_05685 [Borrelia turicatae]